MPRATLCTLLMSWFCVSISSRAAAEEPVTLRVMTFNVWYGGDQVNLFKVGEAIRAAEADIVGVQEADGNLERIAELSGLPHVDPRRRLLSRWPIFDSGLGVRTEQGASLYSTTGLDLDALHAWVMVSPGKVVAVSNVHLSSDPSGLEVARTGAKLPEVLELERNTRAAEAKPLTVLGKVAAHGAPVFLTGDFNTPSHLDWTEAAKRARPDIPYAVQWPATKVLADAGLRDSYREAYPDPVARPGITWTPGTPHPIQPPSPGRDRIDLVLTAGRTRTLASKIVGETGGPDVDIEIASWPTDHRAVVSTFSVIPAEAPPLISVTPRLVEQGGTFLMRSYDPIGESWTGLIVRRGATPKEAIIGVKDLPDSYQRAIRLSSHDLVPGDYEALLVSHNGKVLKRNAFTIAAKGREPQVALVASNVRAGSKMRVRWGNSPGALRDWIGIYAAGETDVMRYLGFVYTEAMFDGEATLEPDAAHRPLLPGDYDLRLMHDETFVVLADAPFRIAP